MVRCGFGLLIFSWLLLVLTHAQDTITDEDRLQSMSNEELEQICIERGFEILKDEIDVSTGLPYELSHDDYVEAALKCLEIEREMYVGLDVISNW